MNYDTATEVYPTKISFRRFLQTECSSWRWDYKEPVPIQVLNNRIQLSEFICAVTFVIKNLALKTDDWKNLHMLFSVKIRLKMSELLNHWN